MDSFDEVIRTQKYNKITFTQHYKDEEYHRCKRTQSVCLKFNKKKHNEITLHSVGKITNRGAEALRRVLAKAIDEDK